jgi:lipoprotein-anchoring transpeptidase ErfK/SrfK
MEPKIMKNNTLSRRTLLRLGLAGAIGALLPGRSAWARSVAPTHAPILRLADEEQGIGYGLVLAGGVVLRAEPNVKAKRVRTLKRDEVLALLERVESNSGSAYNKVWYKIEGGYVHSANVLPVPWNSGQPPITEAGDFGFWAEMVVPFFDVRVGPGLSSGRAAYRYYGGAVHKVQNVVTAESVPPADKMMFGAIDKYWYQIEDEQFPARYFVPASYMRIVIEEEMAPISGDLDARDKLAVVNLKEQRVYAYEKDKEVFTCRCATGRNYDGMDFQTPRGEHFVYRKTPSQHMWGGAVGNEGAFNLPGVPWVSYFTTNGVAFHGTYWHNDYGAPRSHGCVNVASEDAKWLFRWTMPYIDPDPKNWYTQAPWRKPDFTKVTKVKVV